MFDWTCPSNTQGEGVTPLALSEHSRGHGAGCFAGGLRTGLCAASLQMWAESWSACQPLYGNEPGQSDGPGIQRRVFAESSRV